MTILVNMGGVMSEPVTEKVSSDESGENVKYGVSSMQGWRNSQEDAHTCLVNFDENTSLFAVFDGHGGHEVAEYCSQNLPNVLKQTKQFSEGDVESALIDTFLQVDASLNTPEVMSKLKELAVKEGKDSDSVSDVESVGELQEEAEMPLEKLMAKYKIHAEVNGKVEDNKDSNCIENTNGVAHTNGFAKPEVEDASLDCKENCDVEMADDTAFKTPTVPTKKAKAPLYGSLLEESFSEDEADKSFVPDSDMTDEDEDKEMEEAESDKGKQGDDEEDSDDEEDGDEEDDDDEWEDVEEEEKDDDAVYEAGLTCGTTALVAVLRGKELFVANVGDSRCVVSQNGVAVELSRDHKPTVPEEADRISKAGGSRNLAMEGRVEGDLSLSRAIGDHRYKQNKDLPPEQQMITALPEVKNLLIDPEQHDFMILACDGIWDCLSSQEVVDFVRPRIMENGEKLSSVCEELLDRCLAPKQATGESGWDNMTAIIVKFGPGLVTVGRKSAKRGTPVVEEEGLKCQKTESV